jgi:hypothetical protein
MSYILKEDVGTFKNAKGEEKTSWREIGRMVKHSKGSGFSIFLDEIPNRVDGVDSNGVKLSSSGFHQFSAFEIVEKDKAETVVNTKPANEVDTSIDALAEQVAKLQAQANA